MLENILHPTYLKSIRARMLTDRRVNITGLSNDRCEINKPAAYIEALITDRRDLLKAVDWLMVRSVRDDTDAYMRVHPGDFSKLLDDHKAALERIIELEETKRDYENQFRAMESALNKADYAINHVVVVGRIVSKDTGFLHIRCEAQTIRVVTHDEALRPQMVIAVVGQLNTPQKSGEGLFILPTSIRIMYNPWEDE